MDRLRLGVANTGNFSCVIIFYEVHDHYKIVKINFMNICAQHYST